MRYVASYLLAALGGNSSPSAKDIKKILDSVGIEADDDRLNKVPCCFPCTLWCVCKCRPVTALIVTILDLGLTFKRRYCR